MTCPIHVPVVTEGPEGDYIRTDCRACGMTLPREGDSPEDFTSTEIEDGAAPDCVDFHADGAETCDVCVTFEERLAAYNRQMTSQEIADFAFENGILTEPLDVSDTVAVALRGNTLVLTFADDDELVINPPGSPEGSGPILSEHETQGEAIAASIESLTADPEAE